MFSFSCQMQLYVRSYVRIQLYVRSYVRIATLGLNLLKQAITTTNCTEVAHPLFFLQRGPMFEYSYKEFIFWQLAIGRWTYRVEYDLQPFVYPSLVPVPLSLIETDFSFLRRVLIDQQLTDPFFTRRLSISYRL